MKDKLFEYKYDSMQISDLSEIVPVIGDRLSEKKIDDKLNLGLQLAIEELVSNIILYGYNGKGGYVYLGGVSENGVLTIELIDNAPYFDPLKNPEPDTTLSAEEREIGGLGIHFVRKIMDNVNYRRENEQNILSISKKLLETESQAA